MSILKFIILFTILLNNHFGTHSLSIPFISNIQDIIGLAQDINDIASGTSPIQTLFNPQPNPLNIALEKIANIANRIDSLKDTIEGEFDVALQTLLHRLPQQDKINRRIEEFHKHIVRVDKLFEDLRQYSNSSKNFNQRTLKDFVNTVTTLKFGGIGNTLDKLNNVIVSRIPVYLHDGLLHLLTRKEIETVRPQDFCDSTHSHQQRMLDIYGMALLTELRAHTAISFAYRFIRETKKVNVDGEMKKSESRLVLRAEEYMLELLTVLRDSPREAYRCDPPEHIMDTTYAELEGPFSSMIVTESQIKYKNGSTCLYKCGDIDTDDEKVVSNTLYSCSKGEHGESYGYCGSHRCHGHMHSCHWIGQSDYCESPNEKAVKRFNFIKSEMGRYGTSCTGQEDTMYTATRVAEFSQCDNCLCKCDQRGAEVGGTRAISLRPQMADVDNNMVLTNVKFVRQNHMIHFQIEQAKLLPQGDYKSNSKEWVPLEDISYHGDTADGRFVIKNGGQESELSHGEDYVFITADQKTLNLDEIKLPAGHVITGVRLSLKTEEEGEEKPIELQVHVTPTNLRAGKFSGESFWMTADNQPNKPRWYSRPRLEISTEGYTYDGYEYDTNVTKTGIPDIIANKYVQFKRSSTRSDVGQSTVPYFDLRPAAIRSQVMDGLGILWRGNDKFAGFISFKIFSIDVSQYINPYLSNDQLTFYTETYPAKMQHQPVAENSDSK